MAAEPSLGQVARCAIRRMEKGTYPSLLALAAVHMTPLQSLPSTDWRHTNGNRDEADLPGGSTQQREEKRNAVENAC